MANKVESRKFSTTREKEARKKGAVGIAVKKREKKRKRSFLESSGSFFKNCERKKAEMFQVEKKYYLGNI